METQGIINTVGKILTSYHFKGYTSPSEAFAQQRFQKKLEVPDTSKSEERANKCWQDYLDFDCTLPTKLTLPSGDWYRARDLIHKSMKSFRIAEVVFTNGSEVTPTNGRNSLESKLSRSSWDCTIDCFEDWAILAWSCSALKRATRKRFEKAMGHNRLLIRQFHKESYRMFKNPFLRFRRTLSYVTNVCDYSRFGTVPKNNEKDRPIDVQPLCNILVQRTIGNGIRKVLLQHFSVDLDHVHVKHGTMISDLTKATIDLQNASDSVSLALCNFLLPKEFLARLKRARTPYTLGPDGDFHVLKKVSSMGNGFTFELMTLILLSLTRVLDPESSVFGDDIIIAQKKALRLRLLLEEVGFVVNREKSFVDGYFRESCGYNYIAPDGYIKSFFFKYPKTIADCVSICNKLYILAHTYPSFKNLHYAVLRVLPRALQGPPTHKAKFACDTCGQDWNKDLELDKWIWTDKPDMKLQPRLDKTLLSSCLKELWGYEGRIEFFTALEASMKTFSPKRSSLFMRHHYGKYLSYLHSGQRVDDVISGSNAPKECLMISIDRKSFFKAKSVISALSEYQMSLVIMIALWATLFERRRGEEILLRQ